MIPITTAVEPKVFSLMLVDDHAVFRDGLKNILEHDKTFRIVGQATTASEALEKVAQLQPQMVIAEIALEGASGLELSKKLRRAYPSLRILILSMFDEAVYAERALCAGANGYLMKKESGATLLDAITHVLQNKTYVSEAVNQRLLLNYSRSPSAPSHSAIDLLTGKEFEALQLIARGFSTREIGQKMGISVKTVESHRSHIREKFRLKTGSELTRFALNWANSQDL